MTAGANGLIPTEVRVETISGARNERRARAAAGGNPGASEFRHGVDEHDELTMDSIRESFAPPFAPGGCSIPRSGLSARSPSHAPIAQMDRASDYESGGATYPLAPPSSGRPLTLQDPADPAWAGLGSVSCQMPPGARNSFAPPFAPPGVHTGRD
jgi:hypothetical protein